MGRNGNLAKRFVGPFEIKSRIRDVAYRLVLPLELAGVHDVFHVSILRKYVSDPTHVLQHEPLELQADATYAEWPMQITDTKEIVLRTKTIQWVEYNGSIIVQRKLCGRSKIKSRRLTLIFFLIRYV